MVAFWLRENPLLCAKADQTRHQTAFKWQGFVSTAELWFWVQTPITEVEAEHTARCQTVLCFWRRQLIFIRINESECLSSGTQRMKEHLICPVFWKKNTFCRFLSSIQHVKFNGRNLSKVVLCKHSLCLYFSRSCSYRNKTAVLNFAIKIYIGKYSVGIQKSVNDFHENRSGKNQQVQ